MKGLNLLIQSAESLPFLGFYTEPQAYCVIKYKQQRRVSPISKIGRNPFWMFQTELNLLQNFKNAPIEFYVYNSNSNGEDELLGWLHILSNQMNFITLTKTKYQLNNLQGHRIGSFINISSKRLPHIQTDHFTKKQCVKVEMLNYVQIQNEDFSTINVANGLVKLQYGNYVTGLKYGERNHVTFPYNNLDELIVSLQGIENVKNSQNLWMNFNLKNLKQKQPQFFKLRFFDPVFPQINYVASLVFTVIPNSNLPVGYSLMQLNVKSDIKENFFVRVNSPLQTIILKSIGNGKSFKLPYSYSTVSFDYFDIQKIDEKDLIKENDEEYILKILSKYRPVQSTKVQINELQWTSSQHSQFRWQIKSQKITKNLTLEFQALKQIKAPTKQIYPVNFIASSVNQKTIKLKEIKISSCYLYEVLPLESQIQIYHVDFYGKVVNFGSFVVKTNQSEYIIDSRIILTNQGGQLVFVCFQLKLKDSQQKEETLASKEFLENHMIFKVKTQKDKQLMSGRIIYNNYFTSFAKKVSLTKFCKKFQQALHNEAMTVQPKFQLWMPFKKGLFELINCQLLGSESFNSLQFTAGTSKQMFEGFGEQFLCQKPTFFFVQNEKISLKIVTQEMQTSLQYDFCQIFGNPQNTMNEVKTYLRQIDIKNGKLKLWFKFTPLDSKAQQKQVSLLGDQNLCQYSPHFPVKIQAKRLRILKKQGKYILGINPQNQLALKLRMTHQTGHYESHTQKSATGNFLLNPKQSNILTRPSTSEEGRYIFLSVQVSQTKNNNSKDIQTLPLSQEKQNQQKYYNSVIDITKILGKGLIQVKFYDNKTGKLQVIGQFEVFSQNIYKKQIPLGLSIKYPALCIKMNELKLENKLKYLQNFTGYQQGLLKNIYSYFIMFIVNGSYHSLVALDSNSKFCQKQTLPVKQIINNQFLLLDNKSIVEIKVISRLKKIEAKQLHQKFTELNVKSIQYGRGDLKQKLMDLQIEVIGEKTLTFAQIYYKQENKQFFIQTNVPYYGNRQIQSKFSHEQISIMRKSVTFTLTFYFIMSQGSQEKSFQIQQTMKYTELSVLKQCVGLLRLRSIYPQNINLLKQLKNGDIIVSVNSQQLQYLPLGNLFQPQISILVEKCELKFCLFNKKSPEIIIKKISLPSYLKTNQVWSHQIQIGEFYISFQIECFSNGLTTFNQGNLLLKDISFMNGKADKVKFYYPSQQNNQLSYFSDEKPVTGGKALLGSVVQIQRKMKKFFTGALFFQIFIESQKKKILAKIYLSQLTVSTKLSQQNSGMIKISFQNQIKIPNQKNTFSMCISGQYQVQKNDSLKESKKIIKYTVLGQRQKELEVPENVLNREIINNFSNKGQNIVPSRQNGVKLQLQLPEKFLFHLHLNNMQHILQDITIQGSNKGEVFTLIKSKQKPNIYYKYLDRLIQVKLLGFKEKISEGMKTAQSKFKIQLLNINQVKNSTRPVFRFIIDENPQFILTVSQSSYQIPKSIKIQKALKPKQNSESLIFEVSVHKLLSLPIFNRLFSKIESSTKEISSQQKRLLCLKNSANDEILTNKFCLYFKHGRQQQIIFGIDLEGNLTDSQRSQNSIRFGYDAQDDEIDIFLCVENFWNKSQYKENSQGKNGFFVEKYSYNEIEKKWISIMPLNHYLIKISQIKKNNINFSSIMKPYQYNLTQSSLAKQLYQRFQTKDIGIFGSFNFQQGYWGNLIVKINKVGPIKFKSGSSSKKDKTPKILCYMKISIEHKKVVLKEINTQAQQCIEGQFLSFKTFLSHLFLQSKEQSDKKFLKFEMFTISEHSSKERIFQKRYPLQDIFSHQMRNEKVNISISQSDSNQLTQHFQMQVLFTNTKQLQNSTVFTTDIFTQKNLIQTSNSNVQQVDMVSYKNKSFIDFLKMLLSTHDVTHFQGYLKEIKESFIYEEITFDSVQSPFATLIILLPYLKTNAIFCYIDILQMVEMSILKNQVVIKYLDEIKTTQNRPFLYSLFKSILEKDNKEEFLKHETTAQFQQNVKKLISTFNEIKGKENKVSLQKFFTKSNIQKLSQCIENHSNLFNTKNISSNYLNEQVTKLMLSIISQIIEHSENFLLVMAQHINQWIEFTAYKSLPILKKTVQIIDKIYLNHKQLLSQQTFQKMMTILLDRKVQIDTVYQYWLRLADGSKIQSFEEILAKYYLSLKQQKEQETQQNRQTQEIKKTKILRLFYVFLVKSTKRAAKSQKASRINETQNEKQSQKGSKISQRNYKVELNTDLVKNYRTLFENTLHQSDNVLLLNAISELITTWKQLNALNEETVTFFLNTSKKYLEKDKKKPQKFSTQANFNMKKLQRQNQLELDDQQKRDKILNEKNKKSVLENLINTLKGKQKPLPSIKQKNQSQKKSQGFSKYSKYLITR